MVVPPEIVIINNSHGKKNYTLNLFLCDIPPISGDNRVRT